MLESNIKNNSMEKKVSLPKLMQPSTTSALGSEGSIQEQHSTQIDALRGKTILET